MAHVGESPVTDRDGAAPPGAPEVDVTPVAESVTHHGDPVRLRRPAVDEARPHTPSEYDEWDAFDAPMVPELDRLLVEHRGDDEVWNVVGEVSWHAEFYGPSRGSLAWNIGIGLVPEARGRGIGAVAQRILAKWLHETTHVTRVEASTDVANIAEQRALARAGFTFEGVLRQAQQRKDGKHDLQVWSLLPGEA